MYKPPQNCNRVKSIKNKFENIENHRDQAASPATDCRSSLINNNLFSVRKTEPLIENPRNSQPTPSSTRSSSKPQEYLCGTIGNGHPLLSRQLSDPLKRNIKRTPAFRVDKNSEKTLEKSVVERFETKQKTLFKTKVEQFNSVKGCENRVDKKVKDFDESVEILDTINLNFSDSNNKEINCDVSVSVPKQNNSFLHSSSVANNKNESLASTSFNTFRNTSSKTDSQNLNAFESRSKKPMLIKSKSSHDFQYIRSKFAKEVVSPGKYSPLKSTPDNVNRNVNIIHCTKHDIISCRTIDNDSADDLGEALLLKDMDLSLLYTEPIPKCLRNKNSSESSSGNIESPLLMPKIENIYTKSTLQLTDTDKKEFLESLKKVLRQDLPQGLTDSLRVALKKPLPDGPAPKKPPRTFQHCTDTVLESIPNKNSSFLHVTKEVVEKKNGTKKNGKRSDPKYMLNKLEMALKSNKLRARKQQKVEVSTTSGEDSDDSLLFRSKSCRSLPKAPLNFQDSKPDVRAETLAETTVTTNGISENHFLGDFNCFTSFGCTTPAYERIREPNSSFFVGMDKDPIYAEPIQRKSCSDQETEKRNNRNSLYYMSTAVISEDTCQSGTGVNGTGVSHFQDIDSKMDDVKEDAGNTLIKRQFSAETSSLSSFTSDMDLNPSPVTDDPHAKIRFLIDNFEKRQTLPKTVKPEKDSDVQNGLSTTPPDSNSRVEVLRNSLKKTLERSFMSDIPLDSPRDSDSEKIDDGKVERMVARFHSFQKAAPKYQQPQINTDTLFYCCLVIEKVHDCAQIKFKFPPNVDIPRDIEHLCFPENPDSPPLEGKSAAQTYSLLITSETGDRTYGYCRRVLPEASSHCLPLAYCILSKYRAPRFYKRILLELESRHGMQNKYRDEMISQFYYKKFPRPGESISIDLSSIEGKRTNYSNFLEESVDLTSYIQVNKTGEYRKSINPKKTEYFVSENDIVESNLTPTYVAYEGNNTELVLTLHPDTRYEDADLQKLHKLPPDILLKIFSSLLLERKVILISSVISELSSCVDSLQSILYPFTWYHTFIPILPESLWDIVESPTPVVCGVLSEEAIEDRIIENAIVVNLDTKSVLVEEGDEMKILSNSMHKIWRQFITLAKKAKSIEYVHSVYLADAYLCVFICCFKTYKQYVVDGQFLKDKLVQNAKTKGIRRFLKMFTETCMFHAFVDAALNNPDSLSAFDKKIELYGSDESRTILEKLMDWHR